MQHRRSIIQAFRMSVSSQYNFHTEEVVSVVVVHLGSPLGSSSSASDRTPGKCCRFESVPRPAAYISKLRSSFSRCWASSTSPPPLHSNLSPIVLYLLLTSINDICQSAVVRPLNRLNHHYHDNFQM